MRRPDPPRVFDPQSGYGEQPPKPKKPPRKPVHRDKAIIAKVLRRPTKGQVKRGNAFLAPR